MLRYARDGKVTEIGLGGADAVSLKLAREKRDEHLETLDRGLDPREEKRKAAAARLKRKTFAEVAKEVIASEAQEQGLAHQRQRRSSLKPQRLDPEPDGRLQAYR